MTELAPKNDQAVLPFASVGLAENWTTEPVATFAAWRHTMKAANGYAYDPRSIKQHVAMWATLVSYCESRGAGITTVSPALVESFFLQLRGRPVKNGQTSVRYAEGEMPEATTSTRRRYAQLLEQTFAYLVKTGIRRGNPIAPLMKQLNKPEAPGFVSYLSKAEEDAFLAVVLARTKPTGMISVIRPYCCSYRPAALPKASSSHLKSPPCRSTTSSRRYRWASAA